MSDDFRSSWNAVYEPLLSAQPGAPFVLAQLGQSLDGRVATPTGASRDISGGAALDHLHRIRALVDAVVVGAGTVVADDPQLTVRRCAGRHPARVVIDRSGRSVNCRRWQADDGVRRLVFSASGGWLPGVERIAVTPDADVAPALVIAELAARGLRRLLIEGGAATVSRFIDAGAVDRLHVAVAPVILGSGRSGLALRPIGPLCEALRPRTATYLLADGDVLFDCDLRGTHPVRTEE